MQSKVNLKGLFLVLSQTSKKSQKRKDNLNLVYNLGIAGITSLKDEISTVQGQNLGINQDQLSLILKAGFTEDDLWIVKYFQLTMKYASNDSERKTIFERFDKEL